MLALLVWKGMKATGRVGVKGWAIARGTLRPSPQLDDAERAAKLKET